MTSLREKKKSPLTENMLMPDSKYRKGMNIKVSINSYKKINTALITIAFTFALIFAEAYPR
jgi:type IV secretory pathway component VirB8